MSIIAVSGIPLKWPLETTFKALALVVRGHFETLNFKPTKGKFKTCYLRLSEKLDPAKVVENICSGNFKNTRLNAYIPDHVPDIPLASQPRKIPQKLSRALKIPEDHKPCEVLKITHTEIMTELQSKYPGLFNLSKKTGHALLEEIGRKILERLKEIIDRGGEACDSCFNLSKCYRRTHPHFGDFQLVLSTLHRVQDAAGQGRDQIREEELSSCSANPYTINNLPFDKVQKACNKYSERINKKVMEHVKSLKTEANEFDSEEEVARKRVREELKKISPFISLIVRQVITKHFVPEKTPFHRMRIYGEPFLPSKEQLSALLRRVRAVHVTRATRTHNLLRLNVPPDHHHALKALDGTVINGAKLVVRSSDVPLYKISRELRAAINAACGVEHDLDEEMPDEAMEDEHAEDWTADVY